MAAFGRMALGVLLGACCFGHMALGVWLWAYALGV